MYGKLAIALNWQPSTFPLSQDSPHPKKSPRTSEKGR